MGDELAALAALEGGGDADLDAELVGLVRLALADALDLGRVQAVDLGAALAAFLIAHPPRQAQQPGERGLERGIAVDLAGNVADDAAEIGLELAQGLFGAVELAGMGVALVLDEGELADPRIGLAQLDAEPIGCLEILCTPPAPCGASALWSWLQQLSVWQASAWYNAVMAAVLPTRAKAIATIRNMFFTVMVLALLLKSTGPV